jgi:hypothetical protein
MDETMVTQLTNLIIREQYKRIDAMLILRNNKLVYENYFHGYSSDIEHNIFSAGKVSRQYWSVLQSIRDLLKV